MRQSQESNTASKHSKGTVTNGSRNELIPIINNAGEQMVDAMDLHSFLKVKTPFNQWIVRRVAEYKYSEGLDFQTNLLKSPNSRPSKAYTLTLDTAKELAMVERNAQGRAIRQYFIAAEKKLRLIATTALPQVSDALRGLKPVKINGRKLYVLREVKAKIGMSLKGSASNGRKHYGQHFMLIGQQLHVTEEYALHLAHNRMVFNNREKLKAAQPILALDFGVGSVSTEGGYHV
jgi:phage anti-repressor protein